MARESAFSFAYLVASACNPARAALNYNIYESSGNLILETSGSLNITTTGTATAYCGFDGALTLSFNVFCTGDDIGLESFSISGPDHFSAGTDDLFPTDSVSGMTTALDLNNASFLINPSYVSGTPINGSATFYGKYLTEIAISSSGSLGTWTIVSTGDTITVNATNPSPAPAGAPGTLPILGASEAFSISRRLRRSLGTSKINRVVP